MDEEKLKTLNIPYGHRMKMLKKISEMKETRPLSKIDYEELPGPADEVYDEELQRKLFQDAVEEFRKGAKIQEESEEPIKAESKGFFYNLGGSQLDFNNFALYEENGCCPEKKNFLPITDEKFSCWLCYKLLVKETALVKYLKYNKYFCTSECLQKFESESIVILIY